MKIKVYQYIARQLVRVENIRANPHITASADTVLHELEDWVREHGPSGSGIDNGTRLENSSSNRLALKASFRHMTDGFYDGWTNHMIIVKPDLAMEIDLHVSGQDRNEIKDYLHEVFRCWLTSEVQV